MVRSRLLDRGASYVDVYPEIVVVNARGTKKRVPADVPVRVRVTTAVDQSQIADLSGQIQMKVLRIVARTAPVGSWGRIVYEGEEYDLSAPPRFTPGASKLTRHVEFTIRSRSQLGVAGG